MPDNGPHVWTLRFPLSKARCRIPALGWYEWKEVEWVNPETGEIQKVKQPHFIRVPGGGPFALAGLMARWTPEGAELLERVVGPAQ